MNHKLFALGLFLAALGILIEYLTGVQGFPKVPPGPIILGVAAVIVAFVPWRWTPVIGLVATAFITIGAIAAFAVKGGATNQWDFPGPLIGTIIQIVGLLMAIAYGIPAVTRLFR